MSQPNPNFGEYDYTTPRERRGPAPITNLPVNALSGDTDPTRELRALIEQLQQSARTARAQLHTAEGERNELSEQLDHLRRQNEDLRAHFVEITSIIRERDSALQEVDRLSRVAGEVQARLSSAQRELEDAHRLRDELARTREEASRIREETGRYREEAQRQLDVLTRSSQDTNRRFNEVQKQLFSIRQARDSAQAQNTELTQKLAAAEDDLLGVRDQLDAAEKAVAEARSKAADPEQIALMRQERDSAQGQVAEISAELQQLRAKIIDLTEQKAAALESGSAHATALVEAHDQVANLTRERDTARAELESKDQLIEQMRQNPDEAMTAALEQAKREITGLKHEREAADVRVQLLTREIMDVRQQLQARAEQIAAMQRNLDEVTARAAQTQAQFEQLDQDRAAAVSVREEAMTSLAAAQKQIDRIIRERDLIRQQSTENAISAEAQIEALRAQLFVYEVSDPDGGARVADVRQFAERLALLEEERRELAHRLEKQRSETIDLGAQLQAAQEQIRGLSASLAEARLQSLSAGRGAAQKKASPVGRSDTPSAAVVPAAPVFDVGPVVTAMQQFYQSFTRNPSELRLLSELAAQAQSYAELARASGLVATHRASAAFAGLAQELYQYPEQVTPTILRTLQQGIEFLATLPKLSNLASAKDPATAIVYAVDDDADNGECIRMAMETAMIRAVSVQDPAKALCDLASTPCDLIFLDVSMPGMDGFELCASIRNLALHAHTPVIFLTGLSTAENRVQSNLSGGNEFVGKPFLLCELTVKALMLMMKAQLHLA